MSESLTALQENFKNETLKEIDAKVYAVMMFHTALELELPDAKPGQWINTNTVYCGEDGARALYIYANTPCPASQLIYANSEEELAYKHAEMIENFQNQEWLETNLYPCF